ncbi:MAG: HD domain-containing protein [SAR324 cluster bacterium]|nr:HD domain-containing protein [SAR324 cluster bacterium]
MAKKKKRLIRCPIYGSIGFAEEEMALIGSPFLQRLRSVSQLGFASLVFPGATHTRFSHSLGACHLAGLVFDQLLLGEHHDLADYYTPDELAYFKRLLRLSALMHDVGHPPFSHAAESVLPDTDKLPLPSFLKPEKTRIATHEDFTFAIIWEIAQSEGIISLEEAEDIIAILSKNATPSSRLNAKDGEPLIYPLLCQLISGEVDVDRMDYLLRDAYFAGVPYGNYDYQRLIGSFATTLEKTTNRFLLTIKSEDIPTYENFLLSRMHMFYQIYFHKTLGAFTHYITQVFVQKEVDIKIDGTLENYLATTENGLKDEINRAKDKTWAKRIAMRIPAKTLMRVTAGDAKRLNKMKEVEGQLKAAGIDFFGVHSFNQYSSQVKGEPIDESTLLVLEQELGKSIVVPLAERSKLLQEHEQRIEVHQLYVHREDYRKSLEILGVPYE